MVSGWLSPSSPPLGFPNPGPQLLRLLQAPPVVEERHEVALDQQGRGVAGPRTGLQAGERPAVEILRLVEPSQDVGDRPQVRQALGHLGAVRPVEARPLAHRRLEVPLGVLVAPLGDPELPQVIVGLRQGLVGWPEDPPADLEGALQEPLRLRHQSEARVALPDGLHETRLDLLLPLQPLLDLGGALVEELDGGDRFAEGAAGVRNLEDLLQEAGHPGRLRGFLLGALRRRDRQVPLLHQAEAEGRDGGGQGRRHQRRRRHAPPVPAQELARPVGPAVRPRGDGHPRLVAPEVLGELLGRAVAALRLLAQGGGDDGVEIPPQAAPKTRDRGLRETELFQALRRQPLARARRIDLAQDLLQAVEGQAVEVEGMGAGEEPVQQHAQGVDVGRRGEGLAADLLRAGVGRREQAQPGPGRLPEGPPGGVRAVRLQELGDAEVQELRRTVGGDQDVGRLEVAVDGEVPVGEVDRPADRPHQVDAIAQRHPVDAAVLVDGQTVDVLHDEVRPPVVGAAAVEQAGDVRVVEARQDLPLLAHPGEDVPGVEAPPHQLQGHVLAEGAVVPVGEVDVGETAAAELAQDAVGADALRQRLRVLVRRALPSGRDGGEQPGEGIDLLDVRRQQSLHPAAQLLVALAGRLQEPSPLGHGQLVRLVEEGLDAVPPAAVRVAPGLGTGRRRQAHEAALRASATQARARRRSRSTERDESSRASPISAAVMPPK